MLKTVIEHYVKHGSTDIISALDIFKAFDTVDRYALLNSVNGQGISLLCCKTGLCYACVRWGGSLSYWYLVLCYSWCELGRRVIASFVCNLIYLKECFDSKNKIIWLWLLSVWCIFWLPNVC